MLLSVTVSAKYRVVYEGVLLAEMHKLAVILFHPLYNADYTNAKATCCHTDRKSRLKPSLRKEHSDVILVSNQDDKFSGLSMLKFNDYLG